MKVLKTTLGIVSSLVGTLAGIAAIAAFFGIEGVVVTDWFAFLYGLFLCAFIGYILLSSAGDAMRNHTAGLIALELGFLLFWLLFGVYGLAKSTEFVRGW